MALAVWARSIGYKTSLNVTNLDMSFNNIQAVKIVHGKRLKQEFITVLLFIDGPTGQGVYALNYKITLDISQAKKGL